MRYRKNFIKTQLQKGRPVIGSWLNLPSLEVAEILARQDFDFLVVDQEHTAIDDGLAQHMAMVIEGYRPLPLMRVQANNQAVIKRALEAGFYGVIVPMINSRKDAESAIASVYYPPHGQRGVGLSRAQGYGLEFERYRKWHRENLLLVAQIEHIDAIEHLEDILELKEIDATLIGPYDLSASLGYPGEFQRKEVRAALSRYEKVSRKMGKPYGYHVVHPEQKALREKINKGYQFMAYGVDEIFLSQKCHEASRDIRGRKTKS